MIKIKYVIILLVPAILLAQGSFRRQKIDRVAVSTESQITMEDTVRLDTLTGDTVPFLNASKDLTSSSVTPAELGYVSGVTSSIQTQIDGKEPILTKGDLTETGSSILTVTGGTGAVIGSGVTLEVQQASSLASGYLTNSDWSLFNGKQDTISGTPNEIDVIANVVSIVDNPVFSGLESVTLPAGADGDRPSSPVNGMIRYNTTSSSFEGYQAGAWGELGGGGGVGGSRLQLISDPSFEEGVTEGSCTGCTATQDTTDKLGTDNNLASLKMAFSASSGDYTLTKSTSAQYSNVAGTVSAWIKTSASDCHFDELVDGTQSQTVAIGSSDEWKQYIINGTTGTTSYGWRVRCDTAITDDVFVDETFAGAAEPDVFDIGTASLFGYIQWTGTSLGDDGCTWTRSSTSWGAFSADTDCDDAAATGNGLYMSSDLSAGSSDLQVPQIKFSYIPAGKLVCTASGMFYQTDGAAQAGYRFTDGTNTTDGIAILASGVGSAHPVIKGTFNYTTAQTSETTIQLNAVKYVSGSTSIYVRNSFEETLRIECVHYPAPQKVVAAKCDGLECENSFSARISGTDIVSESPEGWLSSVTNGSTGNYVVNFTSSLFGSAPSIQVTADYTSGANKNAEYETPTTSSVTVYTRDLVTGSAGNSDFTITATRQGSDYKQFDQRFIPVVDPEARFAKATSSNFTGTAQTKLDLIDNDDNYNMINETLDRYEIDKTGLYEIKITGSSSAGTSNWFGLWYSVNGGAITLLEGIAPTASAGVTQSGSVNIRLNSGDYVEIYANSGSTTAVTSITSSVKLFSENLNAFIGNLTPKEFIQTPGSTKPVMYSATLDNTGAGCDITVEIGDWLDSCDRDGLGDIGLNITSGAFANNNIVCTTSAINPVTTLSETLFDLVSNTSIEYRTPNRATGTEVDADMMITCHGVQ